MEKLRNKVQALTTDMLIQTFKGLEAKTGRDADLVNEVVMDELELRLPENEFIDLLDSVYED